MLAESATHSWHTDHTRNTVTFVLLWFLQDETAVAVPMLHVVAYTAFLQPYTAHLQVYDPLAARLAALVAVQRVIVCGGDDHGAQRKSHVHATCGGGEGEEVAESEAK